jgi:hypothetical protein
VGVTEMMVSRGCSEANGETGAGAPAASGEVFESDTPRRLPSVRIPSCADAISVSVTRTGSPEFSD